MLPHEQVYEKIGGIWNLSSDQASRASERASVARPRSFAADLPTGSL